MKLSISTITLGVSNIERSIAFYEKGLNFPLIDGPEHAIFFDTGGARLCIILIEDLRDDIQISPSIKEGFPGVTLVIRAESEQSVDEIIGKAVIAGGKLVKPGQPAFWGGYAACFTDPDGYYWEVVSS